MKCGLVDSLGVVYISPYKSEWIDAMSLSVNTRAARPQRKHGHRKANFLTILLLQRRAYAFDWSAQQLPEMISPE